MRKHRVPQALDLTRLDKALAVIFSVTRNWAQQKIKRGGVRLNGQKNVSAHAKIRAGQIISIDEQKEGKSVGQLIPSTQRPLSLKIIYEDEDVLVINKPAGLIVHPPNLSPKIGRRLVTDKNEPTLLDLLLTSRPSLRRIGDPIRPALVHRLDKEVSGVMIIAKKQSAYEHLKKQFQTRLVKKEYLALVHGHLSRQSGTIRLKIARSSSRPRMAARPLSQEGREAITHYEVLERRGPNDLVLVRIETGRTHQIRVHLFSIGHPIISDPLYRSRSSLTTPYQHLALHAYRLGILLPSGKEINFVAEPPAILQPSTQIKDKGRLFVLTGPSGVGKSSVAKRLLAALPTLQKIITYTTRQPRPNERPDVDYHFINDSTFKKALQNKEFFESATVYSYRYGNKTTDLEKILKNGQDALIVVDVQGARTIKQSRPDCLTIFLEPGASDELTKRLETRGDLPQKERTDRLATAADEASYAAETDFVVKNPQGKLRETTKKIEKIIRAFTSQPANI